MQHDTNNAYPLRQMLHTFVRLSILRHSSLILPIALHGLHCLSVLHFAETLSWCVLRMVCHLATLAVAFEAVLLTNLFSLLDIEVQRDVADSQLLQRVTGCCVRTVRSTSSHAGHHLASSTPPLLECRAEPGTSSLWFCCGLSRQSHRICAVTRTCNQADQAAMHRSEHTSAVLLLRILGTDAPQIHAQQRAALLLLVSHLCGTHTLIRHVQPVIQLSRVLGYRPGQVWQAIVVQHGSAWIDSGAPQPSLTRRCVRRHDLMHSLRSTRLSVRWACAILLVHHVFSEAASYALKLCRRVKSPHIPDARMRTSSPAIGSELPRLCTPEE